MPNAERKPDEEWRLHRREITRLSGFMTRADMTQTMRECYNFDANTRQCAYRATEKWGSYKNNRSPTQSRKSAKKPSSPKDGSDHDTLKYMFPTDEFYLAVCDRGRAFPRYMERLNKINISGLDKFMDVLISCARACETEEDAGRIVRYIDKALGKPDERGNAKSYRYVFLPIIKRYVLEQVGLSSGSAGEAVMPGLAGLADEDPLPTPEASRRPFWDIPASMIGRYGLHVHTGWAGADERYRTEQYRREKMRNFLPNPSSKSVHLDTIPTFLAWCIRELDNDVDGQTDGPCDVLSAACPEEPGIHVACIVWRASIHITCFLYDRWVAQTVAHASSPDATPVDWAKKTMQGLRVSTSEFIATVSSMLVHRGPCKQSESPLHAHAEGLEAYCKHGTLTSLARREAKVLHGKRKGELLELFSSRYVYLAAPSPSPPGMQQFIEAVRMRTAAYKESLDARIVQTRM